MLFQQLQFYYIVVDFPLLSQATLEELKASYRRLCMLYHPDKHRDPELKSQAEQLFNQVHQAYEGKAYEPVEKNHLTNVFHVLWTL